MQAWIYRAKDLGILSDANAAKMFRQFHQNGWHRKEPGDALPSEKPQRFNRLVMHALYEGIISKARAKELLGIPLSQFVGGEVEMKAISVSLNGSMKLDRYSKIQ